MLTVWKYPFTLEMELPKGAEVLTVRMQGDQRTIWALVDLSASTLEKRTFLVVGTGSPIEESVQSLTYIDTYLEGGLVMHLFELSDHK